MASAENCVQITVSFNRQEEVLPLTIRPSLELSDYKVDAAEDELFKALRKAFAIESDDTFYLHEAESGRIMSKESFRDPGYCSNFPSHWYLVVERRPDGKGNAGYVVSSEREEGPSVQKCRLFQYKNEPKPSPSPPFSPIAPQGRIIHEFVYKNVPKCRKTVFLFNRYAIAGVCGHGQEGGEQIYLLFCDYYF